MEYVSFPLGELGAGIDALSAESKIPEGFSERLVNVDPTPEGYLRKRPGYSSAAGWVPIRISSVSGDAATQELCFFLDTGIDATSIDLSEIRSAPLVVHGKLSEIPPATTGWDLTDSNTTHYYSGFSPDTRVTFANGSNSHIIAGSVHNLGEKLYVGVASSDSVISNNNTPFLPNEAIVTISNGNVEVEYVNGNSDFEGFIYLLDGASDSGTVYNQTGVWPGTSLTITASTHQLSNFNILPVLYEGDGAEWREILTDVSIANNGDITFTTSSGFTGGYTNYLAIVRTIDPSQTYAVNMPGSFTLTQDIPITGSFIKYVAYDDDGVTKTRIFPDSIKVEDGILKVTFTNSSVTPRLFQLYWEYARLITNKVCVTNSQVATGNFTSSDCQVTMWGLPHSEIYAEGLQRAGWVTHIDTYRSEAEEHLVAGLGGTFFAPTTDPSYLLGSGFPRLRNRIASSVIVGPAFGTATGRTRGEVSFVGDGEGFAQATAINYIGGLVHYTLSTPSLNVVGTPISSTPNEEDYLTVTQAAYSVHNGTFKIRNVTYGISTITIEVENSSVDSTDFDEQDCGARCGIFTDQISLVSPNDFIPGDILTSNGLSDSDVFTVISGTSSLVVVSGTDTYRTLVGSLRVAAKRTGRIVPLRDIGDVPTVVNFVRGDVVRVGTFLAQITYVNTLPDTSITTSALSGVATLTLSSGDTNGFSVGQRISILRGGAFSGSHTITAVPSLTELSFLTEEDDTVSPIAGTLLGNHIEVDSTLNWEDTVTGTVEVEVVQRWAPIEAPTDSYDRTPKTFPKYLDANPYVNQSIVRSTISNDNMYFTNGADEVFKYDGSSIYRAGLPRWQPQLFVTKDTAATGKIEINQATIPNGSITARSNNVFTVTLGNEFRFTAGQTVRITDSTNTIIATVAAIWNNSTNGFIRIDYTGAAIPSFTLANTSMTAVARYRYYFRLNMVDANSNLIASTVTGADDYVVDLTVDTAIRLRLVGLPPLDAYDYDRIEVEIYRTKLTSVAPFYKITTLEVPFNDYDGYIDYVDTTSDDTLSNFDAVSVATIGAELGTGWSEPLRARYITTSDNRLVLANLRDYPKITATFRDVGDTISSDYNGKRLLLRKNNQDTGTSTDNLNRMAYEWRTSVTDPITNIVFSSGNTYTVTDTSSNSYAVGDWVYLCHTATATPTSLSFAGWFQVTVGGTGSFGIESETGLSWVAGTGVDSIVQATTPTDIPIFLGTDLNYQTSNGNAVTGIGLTNTALRRLVNAINASQRVCQTADFEAWVIASGGSEFGGDSFILSSPKVSPTTLELALPAAIAGIDYYVNDLKRSASQEIAARTQLFSSRVVVSYQNFPELFDRPTDQTSSAVGVFDINPADGQEITGVIPFFGDSAFGGATNDAVVVVFKTNSIYLIDLGGNSINESRVQKVDSRGIGCTAPFSIAPSQNGIMFATNSGIYRLRRDLTVHYIGRKMERIWQEEINTDLLSLATGHYYPIGNQYKLSVPVEDGTANSNVLVYNTVREYTADGFRDGSWTLYSNHPATGWANTTSAAFFGSTGGDVLEVLLPNSERPFHDSGEAIEAVATLRSLDFGDSTRRKAVGYVLVDYRTVEEEMDSTELLSSIDNKNQFQESDRATIKEVDTVSDGLGSTGEVKIRTVKYSIGRRKGVFFQLQFANRELDSGMEIAGVSVRVAGLSDRGILQAKKT